MRRAIVFASVVAGMLAAAPPAWAGTIASTPKATWETNGRVLVDPAPGLDHLRRRDVHAGHGSLRRRAGPRSEPRRLRLVRRRDLRGRRRPTAPSYALMTDGTRIYPGGAFTQIDGKGHHGMAAIQHRRIAADVERQGDRRFRPGARPERADPLSGRHVHLPRRLGALRPRRRQLADRQPAQLGADGRRPRRRHGRRFEPRLRGGFFTHINGGSQNHIAALSPATGSPLTWTTHASAPVLEPRRGRELALRRDRRHRRPGDGVEPDGQEPVDGA